MAWTAPGLLRATDVDPISTIVEQLAASAGEWNRGSLEGFIAPYAQESTFMTPAGPIGRAAMVERYREKYFAAERPRQTLRFEQVEARLLGSDHALMTGRFLLSGGGQPDQSGRFTLVWVHSSGGWRILHDHTS
jgi:ketosteroid isomerase-like protein